MKKIKIWNILDRVIEIWVEFVIWITTRKILYFQELKEQWDCNIERIFDSVK